MGNDEEIQRLQDALDGAMDLLDDIIGGDMLYDPDTQEERESRRVLLEEYQDIRATARELLGQD
jgi:hypothetical protein